MQGPPGDISVKDLIVTVRNKDDKADRYEFKRIAVDEKQEIRKKMKKMKEDSMLLGPGRRPLRWFNGDKITEQLGLETRKKDHKPHIVQHYEM